MSSHHIFLQQQSLVDRVVDEFDCRMWEAAPDDPDSAESEWYRVLDDATTATACHFGYDAAVVKVLVSLASEYLY